jgi:hypothetical protein
VRGRGRGGVGGKGGVGQGGEMNNKIIKNFLKSHLFKHIVEIVLCY